MGATTFTGPLGTFGQGSFADYNPQAGPSFWYQGDMILDPRLPWTFQPGQASDKANLGWPTIGGIPILDVVPTAAAATNIANAATPVSGTAITLVSSSGAGVTVGCSLQSYNGALVTGLLGLDVSAARTVTGTFTNGSPKITFSGVVMLGVQGNDQVTLTTSGTLPTPFALLTTYYVNVIGNGAMMLSATLNGPPISATSAGSGTQTINVTATGGYYPPMNPFTPPVIFGQGSGSGGPIRFWNPAWNLSRTLVITTSADDTGGTYTVAGYDIYGEPMTQTVTGVNNSTVSTTKAFKYIATVTPGGTINSTTVSVGTNDNFGLPLRTDWPEYVTAYWNSVFTIAGTTGSSTFTGADITTATAKTADVRGLLYGGSASDGTKRLYVFWNPQAANINSTVGLVGQQQA